MIKVSIIVPIYNVEKQLPKCLDTLVNQTIDEYEIILVNDGSLDNSQKIIEDYSNKYKNIRAFIKKNGGLSDARNFGLKKARGKYILFVDSDDYIDLKTCETLYNCAENDNLDVLVGNYINVSDGKESININQMDSNTYNGYDFIKKYFLQIKPPIMAWLLFSKKEFLLKNNLFFKKGIYHEDEHLTPTIMLNAKRIKYINYNYYYYVNNPASITNKKDKTKNIMDIYAICDELYEKYQSINDRLVKKLLIDRLVYIRFLAFGMQNEFNKKYCFPKNKVLFKAYKFKNKIKVLLYLLSPKYYFKLLEKKKRS